MPKRDHLFYNVTNSLCSTCLERVEAKIVFKDEQVLMLKRCPRHGEQTVLVSEDIAYYRQCQEFIKPGDMPLQWNTPVRLGCPYDCGLCPEHEQHSCLAIVEVTERCNLNCPICYAGAGTGDVEPISGQARRHRSLEEIEALLDTVVRNEGEPDVVQLSGGEPTTHPRFFEILDAAKARPIKHLMINTNGLVLAQDRAFCERLAGYMPGIEVYLQFDSFEREALMELRGADLREVHRQAIANLNAVGLSTTLVVTVKKGVNDGELGRIIAYAVAQPCVRGVTFQPIQAAGRLEAYDPAIDRCTLSAVRRAILAQSPIFAPDDLVPVPCHPEGLCLGYALKLANSVVPLSRFVKPREYLSLAGNSIALERDPALRARLFQAFSANHSPTSSAATLEALLRACDPNPAATPSSRLRSLACALSNLASGALSKVGRLSPRPSSPPDPDDCGCLPPELGSKVGYDQVFRVMIVSFLDAHTFDGCSVKRSCIHIAHPDGRMIPFDTYNLFHRAGSPGEQLMMELRATAAGS